jgi:hypothetical protein
VSRPRETNSVHYEPRNKCRHAREVGKVRIIIMKSRWRFVWQGKFTQLGRKGNSQSRYLPPPFSGSKWEVGLLHSLGSFLLSSSFVLRPSSFISPFFRAFQRLPPVPLADRFRSHFFRRVTRAQGAARVKSLKISENIFLIYISNPCAAARSESSPFGKHRLAVSRYYSFLEIANLQWSLNVGSKARLNIG